MSTLNRWPSADEITRLYASLEHAKAERATMVKVLRSLHEVAVAGARDTTRRTTDIRARFASMDKQIDELLVVIGEPIGSTPPSDN